MELRLGDRAGGADTADGLTPLDAISAFHRDGLAMGVGCRPAVGMLEQDEVAEATQLVAGIRDNAVIGSQYRCPGPRSDVDAIILRAIGAGTVAGKHRTPDGPGKPAPGMRRLGQRRHRL